MSLAEDIAGKVKGKPADETTPEPEAVMKPGDAGKRVLAAIANKDAEALEIAIQDCAAGGY